MITDESKEPDAHNNNLLNLVSSVEDSAAFKEAANKLNDATAELNAINKKLEGIYLSISGENAKKQGANPSAVQDLRAEAHSIKQRRSFLLRRIKILETRIAQIKNEFSRKLKLLQSTELSIWKNKAVLERLSGELQTLSMQSYNTAPQQSDEQAGSVDAVTVNPKMEQLERAINRTKAKLNRLDALREQLEHKPKEGNILEAYSLKKYFPIETSFFGKVRRSLKAVDNVTIEVPYGKTMGIVGESGCGKTTMGRLILRLHDITDGRVIFKGMDITTVKGKALRRLRPEMQVIFQDPYSSLSPRLTVGEIIGEGVKAHKLVSKSEHYGYILGIMKKCGLQEIHYNRFPHEFSGGQRQRICIARALAMKPDFIVCDEPVSALDVSIQAQIINLLKDLQRELKLTYLFISHDLSVIEHISDIIGVMYLGNMVESGDREHIFTNPLHPYTKALLSAVPIPDPDIKMNRIVLKGDIPSPANPPSGCKFHTRCNSCMEICKQETPQLREVETGHKVACHLYNE